MSMSPLQLSFYKGMGGKNGALQFNLQRPHWYCEKNPKLKNYEGKFIPAEWLKQDATLVKEDLTSREGCLFLEATSATGKNVYDWDSKITMALSITDLGKILAFMEGPKLDGEGIPIPVKIMHDPGAQTESAGKVGKWLEFSSPKGIKEGVLVNISMKKADGTLTKHMVPLSGDEAKTLVCCIRGALPAMLAWI